jgi:hypothetical protein
MKEKKKFFFFEITGMSLRPLTYLEISNIHYGPPTCHMSSRPRTWTLLFLKYFKFHHVSCSFPWWGIQFFPTCIVRTDEKIHTFSSRTYIHKTFCKNSNYHFNYGCHSNEFLTVNQLHERNPHNFFLCWNPILFAMYIYIYIHLANCEDWVLWLGEGHSLVPLRSY